MSLFKQYYIFLHIPTGKYLGTKARVYLDTEARFTDYELTDTPAVFYSYFGRTGNLRKFLANVLANCFYSTRANFTVLTIDVSADEFELVRYYGKV